MNNYLYGVDEDGILYRQEYDYEKDDDGVILSAKTRWVELDY